MSENALGKGLHMLLQDFHYELPDELIARFPLEKRSSSRLLQLDKKNGAIHHKVFSDVVSLIHPNDLIVFNNTRVIPARLLGHKESGGKVEMLVERVLDQHRVLVHLRASKPPRPQSFLYFDKNIRFEVVKRQEQFFELRCDDARPVIEIIEEIGQIPLPPYFHRSPEKNDQERYQTIYAEEKGSVAAPTAGLHFDTEMMQQLHEKNIATAFVTLHVGAGTFSPVRVEKISEHKMHSEYLEVRAEVSEKIRNTKSQGGRVIAVGTTTARSLETASLTGEIKPFCGETDIFIYPGFQFKCVDALITNFHLPDSTLLMLVSALAGHENVMRAYREAVLKKYRFFSYGDAMWVG